jgi:hypothetical protein
MHFYRHSYLNKKIYSCKKWVLQEVSVSQGEEKLKSIRNMIYFLLGKIDGRRCNNRLVQVLEIDQSINHPHKILRGVQAQVLLRCLLSPAGGVLDVDLQRKQND